MEGVSRRRLARRERALAALRQLGDPILRTRALEVTVFDRALRRQAAQMTDLMDDALGAGLAAPQTGALSRLFVYRFESGESGAIVNPELVRAADTTATGEEGCLSIRDVWVPVERSTAVTLRGADLRGRPLVLSAEGADATILQHELDHLDGILILDRTDAAHRRAALARRDG
jgi:peptide deformylase